MKKRIIAAVLLLLGICGFFVYRNAPDWIQQAIEQQLQKKHERTFEVESMTFSTEDFCFHGVAYASEEPDWKCRYICSLKGYIYDTWPCIHAAMSTASEMEAILPEEDAVYGFCSDGTIQASGADPDLDQILNLYPEETFLFVILTPEDPSSIYSEIDTILEQADGLEGELVICRMKKEEIAYVQRTCAADALEKSTFETLTSPYEVYRIPFGS